VEGIEDIDISTLQRMLSEKLSEMVDNGEKGKAIAIAKQFEKKVYQQLGAMSDKTKLSTTFSKTAFSLQIEHSRKPLDTIKMTALHLNEDFCVLKEDGIYHDNWYHQDIVLRDNREWFTTDGTIPKAALRRDVKKAGTLSSGLGKVYDYQLIEQRVSELEKAVLIVREEQLIQKVDIDVLKASGSNKDKAMMFKEAGWKYQQIADHLGVSVRTVNRWLN